MAVVVDHLVRQTTILVQEIIHLFHHLKVTMVAKEIQDHHFTQVVVAVVPQKQDKIHNLMAQADVGEQELLLV